MSLISDLLNLLVNRFFFISEDIKTELGKKLKERLDEILEKIKDAIDNGKTVKEDYIEKVTNEVMRSLNN